MAAIYYMNSHICPKEFHIYIIWIQIQIFLHLIIDTAVLIKLLHIGAITVIIIASSINRAPQIKDKRGQPLLQCLLIRDLCWHYPEQGGDGSDTRVTAENVVSCKKLFLSEVQRSERSRKSDVEKCTEWRKSERSSEDSWQTKCWSKCGISGAHTCISNFHKQTRSFPRHCKVLQKHPPPFFFSFGEKLGACSLPGGWDWCFLLCLSWCHFMSRFSLDIIPARICANKVTDRLLI